MALTEVTTWRVTIAGEVKIEASDGDKALEVAKKLFRQMDSHISWTLTAEKTFVDKPEV